MAQKLPAMFSVVPVEKIGRIFNCKANVDHTGVAFGACCFTR